VPPATRRIRRRLKSAVLKMDWAYRLYLILKFGASRISEVPRSELPNGTLQNEAEWKDALTLAKRLKVPRHRSPEKNWDHLAAVFAILGNTTPSARILDAGAELYSNVLPALYAYGYRDLVGINLGFTYPARRGPIRYFYGDITQSAFPDNHFDAVTCMSVIEHGVSLEGYFREMVRILKPGGLLITSTDYYPTAIDTRGQTAHGAAIKVFTRAEIEDALRLATEVGLELTGPVGLDCTEKPAGWAKFDLDYTFLVFTLRKPI
jgi:SAM-dependent methyltransferase